MNSERKALLKSTDMPEDKQKFAFDVTSHAL